MVNLIFLYNKHLHIFPFAKETCYVFDIYVLSIYVHTYIHNLMRHQVNN